MKETLFTCAAALKLYYLLSYWLQVQRKCIHAHLTGRSSIKSARFNYYNVELYPSRQSDVFRMVKCFIYVYDILSKLVPSI